eukprot:SAG11_NODE_35193_length_267_cov_58.928571_1_plen_73_part_01
MAQEIREREEEQQRAREARRQHYIQLTDGRFDNEIDCRRDLRWCEPGGHHVPSAQITGWLDEANGDGYCAEHA